jgi:hypothetical protein
MPVPRPVMIVGIHVFPETYCTLRRIIAQLGLISAVNIPLMST